MKAKEFIPKEWVLVRPDLANKWCLARFSHLDNGVYMSVGGIGYQYCIPYNEETKNLLGTTDDYVEHYVPQDGDFVAADDSKDSTIFIYNEKYSNPKYFGTYIGLYRGRNDLSLWESDAWCDRHRKLRLATEEEKQLLLSKLAENGKKWNPEKKCIEGVWTPKDGDFVTYIYPNGNKYVAIYEQKESGSIDEFYADVCLSNNIKEFENKTNYNNRFERGYSEIRVATDTEKQQLLDALHKEGKEWDFEKKEIVEYKWRPNLGEFYWFVTGCGRPSRDIVSELYDEDKERFSIGNCFRTKEEAQAMADKFKKLLKGE